MTSEPKVHQCKCDICKAGSDAEIARHHRQMNLFLSRLDEPQRRWYVGLLSQKRDSPSDRELSKITGLDGKTIRRGRKELETELEALPSDRQRREGGGRPLSEKKTQR